MDYHAEYKKMASVSETLKADKYIVSDSVASWYEYYHLWLKDNYPGELDCKYYKGLK